MKIEIIPKNRYKNADSKNTYLDRVLWDQKRARAQETFKYDKKEGNQERRKGKIKSYWE